MTPSFVRRPCRQRRRFGRGGGEGGADMGTCALLRNKKLNRKALKF